MPRNTIVKYYDPEDHMSYLEYKGHTYGDDHRVDQDPITLKDLANFCDQNAESRNNGAFCGAHRILAVVLFKHMGEEQATTILRMIAEYGGLDGMSGVGGQEGAFAEFGIKDCWSDWDLPTIGEEEKL